MRRIRWNGPSVIFGVTTLLVIVAGLRLTTQAAWAQTDAQITLVRDSLTQNLSLAELSNAFQKVAQVVGPSVVHIQIAVKQRSHFRGHSEEENLLRRFFGPHRFKLNPRDLPDGNNDEDDPDEDLDRYNVPRPLGNGSGWVYDHDGHIITNNHVVKDADALTVRFQDGSERKATVVGTDPKTDIAVIQVDPNDLHPASLATEPVEQGNIVFAFGSPFGFEFSMSQGIVSAKGRRLGILSQGGYENFIQTDSAINRGNSGGPMTNIYGQVVGMNTAIATRSTGFQGLGFAIPVDMVRQVVDQLIDNGRVSRGYLGIYIADLNPKLAKTFGFDGKGVLVEDPIQGSPGEKAGIHRGDIIFKINGNPVGSADQLRRAVASHAPGTTLKLDVFRDGQTMTLQITLGELPEQITRVSHLNDIVAEADRPDKSDQRFLRKLGIDSITTLTEELAQHIDVAFTPGVLVRSIRSGSAAQAGGMAGGHVITAVMGVGVNSVDQFMAELKKHDLTTGIRLSIVAGKIERFVLLELPEE